MAPPKRGLVPHDPLEHARQIAEAVDLAWHRAYGGSRIEIPLSVVAALATFGDDADRPGRDPARRLMLMSRDEFAKALERRWALFAIALPHLLPRALPFYRWLEEDPDKELLMAARAAGHAALKAGLIQLTGVDDRRHSSDVLGVLLQTLRSRGSRQAMGQFLTPVDVTGMIGHLLFAGRSVEAVEGESICEPAAGTGTMLLGAAMAIRESGGDPAKCSWYINDKDWVAAACAAVNAGMWGLGPKVVVGCGDALIDDWVTPALADRDAAIRQTAAMVSGARYLAALELLTDGPRKARPVPVPAEPGDMPRPAVVPQRSALPTRATAFDQVALF